MVVYGKLFLAISLVGHSLGRLERHLFAYGFPGGVERSPPRSFYIAILAAFGAGALITALAVAGSLVGGYVSFLTDSPELITGIAQGEVSALKLKKNDFQSLRQLSPDFDAAVRQLALEDLRL